MSCSDKSLTLIYIAKIKGLLEGLLESKSIINEGFLIYLIVSEYRTGLSLLID